MASLSICVNRRRAVSPSSLIRSCEQCPRHLEVNVAKVRNLISHSLNFCETLAPAFDELSKLIIAFWALSENRFQHIQEHHTQFVQSQILNASNVIGK